MEDDIPDYMSDSFLLGMAEIDQKQAEQRKKEAQKNTLPVNPFTSATHLPSVKTRQEQARQEANANAFHVDEKIAKMAQKMGFPLQIDTEDSKGDLSSILPSGKAFSSPILPVILPKGSGLGSEAYMSAVRRASKSHKQDNSANNSITVPVYVPSHASTSSLSLSSSLPLISSSTSSFSSSSGTTEMKLQKAVIFTASSAPEIAFREEVRSRHETRRLILQLHSLQKSCMLLDTETGIVGNTLWEDLLLPGEDSFKKKNQFQNGSSCISLSQEGKNSSWRSDFTDDGFYPIQLHSIAKEDNGVVMSQLAPLNQKKVLSSDQNTAFPNTLAGRSLDKSVKKTSKKEKERAAMKEYLHFERKTHAKILHTTGATTQTMSDYVEKSESPNYQVFTRLGDQYLGAIAVDEVESESDEDQVDEITTRNQTEYHEKRVSGCSKYDSTTLKPTPSQDWGMMNKEISESKENQVINVRFKEKDASPKVAPAPEEHQGRMKAYQRAVDIFHGKSNITDEKRGYLNRSRVDVDAILSKLVIQAELAASYKDEDAVVVDEDDDENFPHHHSQHTQNCVEEKDEAYYEQRINEIASYMKRKHLYCCWCIRKYSSLVEMANKCPGDLASQHDSDGVNDIEDSNGS